MSGGCALKTLTDDIALIPQNIANKIYYRSQYNITFRRDVLERQAGTAQVMWGESERLYVFRHAFAHGRIRQLAKGSAHVVHHVLGAAGGRGCTRDGRMGNHK